MAPDSPRRDEAVPVGNSRESENNEPVAGPVTQSAAAPGPQNSVHEVSAPALSLAIGLGRQVMVVSDLLLTAEPTPSSLAIATDIARTLERWEGPGTMVVCGNLFAPACPVSTDQRAQAGSHPALPDPPGVTAADVTSALQAHPVLTRAINEFASQPDSAFIVLPGWRDPEIATDPAIGLALSKLGVQIAVSVDLHMTTAAGDRTVVVRPGQPARSAGPLIEPSLSDRREWLDGIDRLEDPTTSRRFVTSRVLYRRLRRYLWVPPLVLVLVALALRLNVVFSGLTDVVHNRRGRRVLTHAYHADWGNRLLVTVIILAALMVVLAGVVAFVSRGIWRALGGGDLPSPFHGVPIASGGDHAPSSRLTVNGSPALDEARSIVAGGATGLVTGGGLSAELAHLDVGFYAAPGGTTELVREHAGRAGLPPVFLHHRQTGWIEIETGAELHVRLLLADIDLPSSTRIERLVTAEHVVKGYKAAAEVHPALVASWPRGASWPAAPDIAADRVRVRRVRRLAAAAIFVAGLVDLLSAVTPPLHSRLHLVQQVLPLGVAQAAGALVALAGITLMMLSRGVLRGQRRAWIISVGLLLASLILHVIHAGYLISFLLTALVLVFLVVQRRRFGAATNTGSFRIAFVTLLFGALVATVAAAIAVEITSHLRHHVLPSNAMVVLGSFERLAGVQSIHFPDRIDDFVTPSLFAVGIALVVVALYLLTRPVVDRRLLSGRGGAGRRAAEIRARDIVRRHGTGTLDYFALRDDKQWFFHRDSMVAYAVFGGVCLVSPDPIGPRSEQAHIWDAFRHFVDRNGWALGVMGAGEEWLPTYRDSGMRHLYIGDEAVVDVQTFSLKGGKMKGLRQAVNRVERYGYTVEFLDPARLTPEEAGPLVHLIDQNRRGEQERGFSMMLGRLFDPRDTGLLLTVVKGPDGVPVAMCQFVPSQAILGHSLDLMRRDSGEHPNGLLDFALCATIDHLRQRGERGLSLNFAAMRSVLDGETGDGVTQRVERWAIRRLSGVLQIESLWKFNAKYEPTWLPRYIVYDSAEQFVPMAVQLMRAESLTEIPVFGRFLTTSQTKRSGPIVPDELLPEGDGPTRANEEPSEIDVHASDMERTNGDGAGTPRDPAHPTARR